MNELQIFRNSEFGELGVLEQDGKPYFPATACARILGYANAKDAIIRHCKGVVKHDLPTSGGIQTLNLIPEGDLYRLITHSKLPAAERFEVWVFDEVLPTIRRTDGYGETALGPSPGTAPPGLMMAGQRKGAAIMRITHLTITQDGQYIGETSIKERAVNAARTRAVETGKPVSVVAHLEDGCDREVVFNPDGTNEKIWDIDKGQRLEPVVGQVYTNRGGGKYRCIAPAAAGPMFYNASGVFQNVESGWTFTAKGVIQYIDGTIEWDHSVGGTFKELAAH